MINLTNQHISTIMNLIDREIEDLEGAASPTYTTVTDSTAETPSFMKNEKTDDNPMSKELKRLYDIKSMFQSEINKVVFTFGVSGYDKSKTTSSNLNFGSSK